MADPKENTATAVKTTLPIRETFIGTVADTTDKLSRNGKDFRIITMVDNNGTNRTFVLNEKFYMRNITRFSNDNTINIVIEKTIEGKTHWIDEDDKITAHTSTVESVVNVTMATSVQTKFQTLDVLERKLADYAEKPALLNAMAALYGNMIRS